ncbi:vigilin-like isoform X2 [Tachypleus tridentatus]|uniref:vigilin-like isoform X2 n=1 Tax=Tachypleus tridentatus TaxID=6853 RepID=UPI003FD0B8CA
MWKIFKMNASQSPAFFEGTEIPIPNWNVQTLSFENSEDSISQSVYNCDNFLIVLPEKSLLQVTSQASARQWNKKVKCGSSFVTRIFSVSIEEQKYQEISCHCVNEQRKLKIICEDITKKTGVHIEVISLSSLYIIMVVMGKGDAVLRAQRKFVNKLKSQDVVNVSVPKEYHRFILGNKGKKLVKLERGTNTKISIPRPENLCDIIKITGTKEGIEKAAREIQVIIDKTTGVSVEVPSLRSPSETTIWRRCDKLGATPSLLIEKATKVVMAELSAPGWLHKHIVGRKGASVKHVIQGFPMIIVEFNIGANKIKLEGPQGALERASKTLENMIADLKASFSCEEIFVDPKYHMHVAEKYRDNVYGLQEETLMLPRISSDSEQGNLIRIEGNLADVTRVKQELLGLVQEMIETETETKTVLPTKNSKTNTLIITDQKENGGALKKSTTTVQDELDDVQEVDIIIPAEFCQFIIDTKGKQIRSISATSGKVRITIPQRGSVNEKVILRGRKEDIDKAKHRLTELLQKKKFRFTVELKAKSEYHKLLIGVKGANVKKVQQKTGARIVFPTNKDKDKETIRITGHKNAAMEAKKILEDMVEDIMLRSFQLHKKFSDNHYRHIVRLKESVISRIKQRHKVHIYIPKNEDPGNRILTITGYKQCAEAAMEDIYKIICRREEMATEEVIINFRFHFRLIGTRRCIMKKIMEEFDVDLEFGSITDFRPNVVTIIGMKDNVKSCKDYLLNFRQKHIMMRRGNENMFIGCYQSSSVRSPLTVGFNSHLETVETVNDTENIEDNVREQFQQSRCTVELKVKPEYHRFLIGRKGLTIKKVRRNTRTRIVFPTIEDENKETIRITGNEDAVMEAKKILEDMVENMVIHRINLPFKVKYKHIIGPRGYVISRIQRKRKVHIHIPKNEEQDNRVIVSGYEQGVEAAVQDIHKIIRMLMSSRRKTKRRVIYRYCGNTIVCPKLMKISSSEYLQYLKDCSMSLEKPKNKIQFKKRRAVNTKEKVIELGTRRQRMKRITKWYCVDLRVIHRLFPLTGMKGKLRKLCISFAELERTMSVT